MSKQTEKELLDVALWYHHHKNDDMPIDQKLQFLTKAIDHILWVLAGSIGDIQKIERGRTVLPRDLVMPYKGIRTATGFIKNID